MLALIHGFDMMAGRVHPGESNSSWMMRGLLEMLTGPSPAAHALRDKYLFMVLVAITTALGFCCHCMLCCWDCRLAENALHDFQPQLWLSLHMKLASYHEAAFLL